MRLASFLLMASLFTSCSSALRFTSPDSRQNELAMEELRIEIADVKHALNSTQVEVRILEDKLKSQDNAIYAFKNQTANKLPMVGHLSELIDTLEKKLSTLEKIQDKTFHDLRQLTTHANQTSSTLMHYKEKMQEIEREMGTQSQRLDEVSKLKSTLTHISKAMKQGDYPQDTIKIYKVIAGDTLEKIARKFYTTSDYIKKLNRFENDRIVVGQEVKVPDGSG